MTPKASWRTPQKLRDRLTSAAVQYIGTPMEHGKPPQTLKFRAVADAVIEAAAADALRQGRTR
jgi:hypothetical protein